MNLLDRPPRKPIERPKPSSPVESPFLPGTRIQYAWDSTALGLLKTCPRKYQYEMLEGWSSREESVHLRFGIEYHHALQCYDLSIAADIKHDDAVHDVVRELLAKTADFDPDHKTKTRESLVRTVVWYLDKFKDDPAQTHIFSNGLPAVEQAFRFELDWGPAAQSRPMFIQEGDELTEVDTTPGAITYMKDLRSPIVEGHHQPYLLCGHLDRIVTYSGEPFVLDYKTVYSFWNKRWEPDNQMTLYSLAAQIVLKAPVKGVIVDMAWLRVLDGEIVPEFKRDLTFRTPDQLTEWVDDLRYWFTLAEQYALANHWPMNDTACDKFGGCKYRDICSKSPSVRESFLEGNFTQLPEEERWNPLKPRD